MTGRKQTGEPAMPLIALIDYDSGNLFSVAQALRKVGADVQLVDRAEVLAEGAFAGLVLPGVGAFGDAAGKLESRGLSRPVRDWIAADRPFLGVCVGYQLLFESSEESPGVAGLGILRGRVRRFASGGLKIPQIGWNQVAFRQRSGVFKGQPGDAWFYFVHAYFPEPTESEIVAGQTEYGESFASAVQRGRLAATQFHPEKSQENGLHLLRQFVEGVG